MSNTPVVTLDWPALVGSGFVVSMLFLALVERLRRTFATQTDLNGLGDRVNALQNLFAQLREATDDLRARLASVETEQKYQWERVAEQVIKPLERITEKLEVVSEHQVAQKSTLEHIEKRLDRSDKQRERRGDHPPGPRGEP